MRLWNGIVRLRRTLFSYFSFVSLYSLQFWIVCFEEYSFS